MTEAIKESTDNAQLIKFSKERVKELRKLYSDESSAGNALNKPINFSSKTYKSADEIRKALQQAVTSGNRDDVVKLSKRMYSINPVYASLISYFSDMFLWRYTITPHKLLTKKINDKPLSSFRIGKNDYATIYQAMVEIVEGLNLEAKAPLILTQLFIEGAAYFTTFCDDDSLTIDTITFPSKYCRKIGETQFGTSIIQLDYEYFNSLGLRKEQVQEFLESFPKEIQEGYQAFINDTRNNRWQTLDPHYSSCIMLNEKAIPVFAYTLGSMINYELYGDNELARNENLLKYIVVHKMPLYQDQLIFEVNEVQAIHEGLSKIVNTSDKTRLITTYGDVSIEKIQDTENTENKVLEKAFESIFNNAGLNASIFTGESVESIKYSLLRDKAQVWKYIEQLTNFYNMCVNSWFDFGSYEANINILPISQYSYENDIIAYRDNATLGIGKLDYIVATGIKQKNIADRFELEKFLKLDEITPLQSSYTQSSKNDDSKKDEEDKKDENPKSSEDDEEKSEPSPNKQDDENKDDVKQEDKNEETKD